MPSAAIAAVIEVLRNSRRDVIETLSAPTGKHINNLCGYLQIYQPERVTVK
jgi:hypothetical protein